MGGGEEELGDRRAQAGVWEGNVRRGKICVRVLEREREKAERVVAK